MSADLLVVAADPKYADENGSHTAIRSEKRDVVGTSLIVPTGKIATVTVTAEYRGQGFRSALPESQIDKASVR